MKKYIKMKPVGGILITLLTALPLYAQDNNEIVGQNTPAALERMKMQNLWLEHTSNAAGAILDNTVRYSTVSLGYDIGNGTFRRPQEGKRVNSLDFKTEGGGIYEGLHGMYVWGSFSYSRYKVHKAEYNASLIDPLRGMPFIIADTNRSNWVNQDYNLEMQMTTPLLWNRVIIGITGRYQNAVGAKQLDPRPLVRLSQFTVIPSVIVKFDKHALGLNFDYYSRREDGSAGNSNNRRDQQVWELRGLGFHSEGVIGGVGGVEGLRNCNANNLGGGIQYSYFSGQVRFLLAGNYDYKVEDVTNNYTRPKMVGTVKDQIITGKLALEIKNKKENSFFTDFGYTDRSIDGIEYVQVYDNTYEVQEWITKFKSIRSNFSTKDWRLNFDYLVSRENEYKWKLGMTALYHQLADIYYLSGSKQDIDNFYVNIHAKRNFDLGKKNKLLVGLDLGLNENLDSEISYTGPDQDSRIIQDFLYRDYAYLSSEYWEGGLSFIYSNGSLMKEKANLFVSAVLNYKDVIKDSPWFGQRVVCSFSVGLNF